MGFLLVLGSVWLGTRRYSLDLAATNNFHLDIVMLEALARSLSEYGPTSSILADGISLRYHWLSYAWSGQMTSAAGADSFVVLTRVVPLVSAIGVVALVAHLSSMRAIKPWVPTLAVVLVIAGGFFGAHMGSTINIDSPSQTVSSMWLMSALLTYFLWMDYKEKVHVRFLLLSGAFVGIVTLTKVSSGIVLVIALATVAVVFVFGKRRLRIQASAAAVLASLVFLLITVAFVSGGGTQFGFFAIYIKASTNQGLDPFDGTLGVVLGTIALLLAVTARWSAGLILLTERGAWRELTAPLIFGFVIAGIVPILVLSQGVNELWFAVSASVPLSFFAAIGISQGSERITMPNQRAVVIGLSLSSLGIGSILWLLGPASVAFAPFLVPFVPWLCALAGFFIILRTKKSTHSRSAAIAAFLIIPILATAGSRLLLNLPTTTLTEGNSPKAGVNSDWTTADKGAGDFLSKKDKKNGRIITNELVPVWKPALTGLPFYVAGAYPSLTSEKDLPELQKRIALTKKFFDDPTANEVRQLCSDNVGWAWVNTTVQLNPNIWDFLSIEHQGPGVIVAKLYGQDCDTPQRSLSPGTN